MILNNIIIKNWHILFVIKLWHSWFLYVFVSMGWYFSKTNLPRSEKQNKSSSKTNENLAYYTLYLPNPQGLSPEYGDIVNEDKVEWLFGHDVSEIGEYRYYI